MKELITLMQSGKLEPTDVMCKLAKVLEVQQAELVSAKAHDAEVRRKVLEEFAYKWLPNLRDTAPESSLHKMTHNMAIDDAVKHALRMAQEQPK